MNVRTCPHCDKVVAPSHFYRSGTVRCQNRLTWTKGRVWQLMTMIEAGKSDAEIGKKLRTTANGVNLYRKRHGIPSRTQTILCCRGVAERLGLGCAKTVTYWIKQGFLRGRQYQPRGGNQQWKVSEDDLIRFLRNPDHWQRWDPNRIVDVGLREFALELRGHVRFLTLGQVAEIHFVESATVHQWIKRGWMPAVRNGNHMVREDDARSFVHPGLVRREFVRAAIVELKRRGFNQTEIARLYGRTDSGHVREWERGDRQPLQRVADRFAAILKETDYAEETEQLAA